MKKLPVGLIKVNLIYDHRVFLQIIILLKRDFSKLVIWQIYASY